MKWYSWLQETYKKIIEKHIIKKAHHAVLINTQRGTGAYTLIWHTSKWILCSNKKNIKYCNRCHSCHLMNIGNHPDWHNILRTNKKNVHVDTIHAINEKIFKCSNQGKDKIIFLSDICQLTESANNAFLKTLEEPPKKTWFFLINYNYTSLYHTLNSRCIIYNLFVPIEQESILWLKKEINKKNISYITALRLNQGSPILTKKFINEKHWDERVNFCKNLFFNIKNKTIINILPMFYNKNTINKIDWICLLLFDAIKFNDIEKKYLSNLDQIEFIQFLSNVYTKKILDKSICTWIKCKYKLSSINGINNELLLLEQLLIWEKILNF